MDEYCVIQETNLSRPKQLRSSIKVNKICLGCENDF